MDIVLLFVLVTVAALGIGALGMAFYADPLRRMGKQPKRLHCFQVHRPKVDDGHRR